MKRLRFSVRWWYWFIFECPSRVVFGFGPDSTEKWCLAMERWEANEPEEVSC